GTGDDLFVVEQYRAVGAADELDRRVHRNRRVDSDAAGCAAECVAQDPRHVAPVARPERTPSAAVHRQLSPTACSAIGTATSTQNSWDRDGSSSATISAVATVWSL